MLEKITVPGLQLDRFPHCRMTGRDGYRLRVGDHRTIHDFDSARNLLGLIALGPRREVYRV